MLRPPHLGPTRVPQFLTELRSARDTRAAAAASPQREPRRRPSRGHVPPRALRLGREEPSDTDQLRRRHEGGGVEAKVLPGPIGSVGRVSERGGSAGEAWGRGGGEMGGERVG